MTHLMGFLVITEHTIVLGSHIDAVSLHSKLPKCCILRQMIGDVDFCILACLRIVPMDGIATKKIDASIRSLDNLANGIAQFLRTAIHRYALGILSIIDQETIHTPNVKQVAIRKKTLRTRNFLQDRLKMRISLFHHDDAITSYGIDALATHLTQVAHRIMRLATNGDVKRGYSFSIEGIDTIPCCYPRKPLVVFKNLINGDARQAVLHRKEMQTVCPSTQRPDG